MLLLAVAVAPGIFWVWYFVRRDRIKPEPQHLIRRVFFAGAAAAIVAALVEQLLFSQPVMSLDATGHWNVVAAATVIGLVEEGAKFLAVYYTVYRHGEFNEAFDGIIYAVAAAMGFATLENIGYVLGGGYGVGAIRALLSVPGHAFFATLMGYNIGIAKFSGTAEARWLVAGILWASLAHAVFDAVLLTRTVLAVLVIPLVVVLWRWSLARSRQAQLLDDQRWGAG
jgi:RsiW-degrading membrane proteinase PrsW (M82 family)